MHLEKPTTLSEDVTLAHIKSFPAVYFLCSGDTIVYIGASKNVLQSLQTPDIAREAWDRAYYKEVKEADLFLVRKEMICKYNPRYNIPCKRSENATSAT